MSAVTNYKRRIYAIRDLPALPVIAQKVLSLADDDGAGTEKLAAIISSDQALSAKVLSLTNSACAGNRETAGTIKRAVATLGINMVKQIALSVLVRGTLGRAGKDGVQFWRHSFGAATAASMIARRARMKNDDLCFMA